MSVRGATYLAVCYYVDDSYYANVGRGTSRRALQVYWRNITVMFASARRHFPASTHFVVFSNVEPPTAPGKVLSRLGVRFEDVGFHQPYPVDFYPRFRGAFHLFDAVEWFSRHLDVHDQAVIVDPDCVWVRDPEAMFKTLERDGLLASCVTYPPDRPANGASRNQIAEFAAAVTGEAVSEPPAYVGGEFLGLTGATVGPFVEAVREATNANIARWRQGDSTLNTEEHVLTYVFWRLALTPNDEGLMRRIQTSPLWKNLSVDPRNDEFDLILWHLPAEKKRGLFWLFNKARNPRTYFWTGSDDDFRERVARQTGIIPSPFRRVNDAVRPPLIRLRHRVGLRRRRVELVRPGE